jgi:hypothetical protein
METIKSFKQYFPIFNHKKNQKILSYWLNKLNITVEGENYVLQHILNRDLCRDIILHDILIIKLENNLISVRVSTRNGSYRFCVCDILGNGWTNGLSEHDKELYVHSDLYHKLSK